MENLIDLEIQPKEFLFESIDKTLWGIIRKIETNTDSKIEKLKNIFSQVGYNLPRPSEPLIYYDFASKTLKSINKGERYFEIHFIPQELNTNQVGEIEGFIAEEEQRLSPEYRQKSRQILRKAAFALRELVDIIISDNIQFEYIVGSTNHEMAEFAKKLGFHYAYLQSDNLNIDQIKSRKSQIIGISRTELIEISNYWQKAIKS